MSIKNLIPFGEPCEPEYEEKLACLEAQDFYDFFHDIGAEPKWGVCGGKECIKVLTLCHHGTHHNAVFDPTTLNITCFSECGETTKLHNWVRKMLDSDNPFHGRDFIEKWMDGQGFDFEMDSSHEVSMNYQVKPFNPYTEIEIVPGIDPDIIKDLYSGFDHSRETLSRLRWCLPKEECEDGEGIPVEQLMAFDVACLPKDNCVILPHHNINGEIVGLYARSYRCLRKEVEKELLEHGEEINDPEIQEYLSHFPRAKYMPLLKPKKYWTKEKPRWSFPNSRNLYGLHKAKEAIRESGKAIVFEGGKSVMLAHAYGYSFAVASHTYGANLNHMAMLIQAGAKEIILAFDKQYQNQSIDSKEWQTYETKTQGLAQQVSKYVTVSRMTDKGDLLNYKDAPIDQGKEVFETLFENREILTVEN